MSSLKNQIKANKSRVFRRLFMKRREQASGLFESSWTEITSDVMKWGKLKTTIDEKQYNKFKFSGARFQLSNDSGRYNPEINPSSLWFGYLSPQRSLVRVEAGFVHETMGADGIWSRTEYPNDEVLYRNISYASAASSETFSTTTAKWGFDFTTTAKNLYLKDMSFNIYKSDASVTGYAVIDIYQGSSITSGELIQTSNSISMALLTTTGSTITTNTITFPTRVKLDPLQNHFWVFNVENVVQDNAGGNYLWVNRSSDTSSGTWFSSDSGANWSLGAGFTYAHDMNFYSDSSTSVFSGFISGDIPTSAKNIVQMSVQPLSDLFRQYPARLLDGWTSTGLTASQFVESVRDHTDGSGVHVFLPFFGDTTTGFIIQTTTVQYGFLNTSTASEVIDSNVWTLIEKLAQSETYVPYVTRSGEFNFVARDAATSTTFEFHGAKSKDREYGLTIKDIKKFGVKYSKYYSRVDVRWSGADTETSIQTTESVFEVSGSNLPWTYGHKTLKQEILFIQDANTAKAVADTVFDDVSALRNEIEFDASFVPQLDILDRVNLTYNNDTFEESSLWDLQNWSELLATTQAASYLDTSGAGSNGLSALGSGYRLAQHFISDTILSYLITVKVPLQRTLVNTTAGYLTMEIHNSSSSLPGSIIGSSDQLDLSLVPTSQPTITSEWVTFSFSAPAILSVGGEYFMMLNPEYGGSTDRYKWFTSNLSAGSSINYVRVSFDSGSSWNNSSNILMGDFILADGPLVESENTLFWDKQSGDALKLEDREFKLLKIELDLDKLSTKITARDAQ